MKSLLKYRITNLFLITVLLFIGQTVHADMLEQEKWTERMRMPWEPSAGGFIRDWLILGDLPNPPHDGDETYNHTDPCVGCDTDYLTEHGGETSIRPIEGMTHTRADGTQIAWFSHNADNDMIDFTKLFGDSPTDNKLAYAFTTVNVDEAGPAMLSIGSDDGVMVWVNGALVHRNIVGRGFWKDADMIPIELKQGENTLLVKVENGWGGWGFGTRVLTKGMLKAFAANRFDPKLTTDSGAATLAVKSDSVSDEDTDVSVSVIRAGGTVVDSAMVPRGDSFMFNTDTWPDGTYEVRCALTRANGKTEYRHLPWFKGDATAAVERLMQAAETADEQTEAGMLTVMLARMARNRLGDDMDSLNSDNILRAHSPLMEFEEVELEKQGHNSRARPFGFVRMAWRDPIDDSVQFCRVYLPPNFDPNTPHPVNVNLHGYYPENPDYIHWWGTDQRHHGRADDFNTIIVDPHGRANTWYFGIGQQDVLRSLDMVKERFTVDDDRVYLSGESMGGGGAWHIASRNPDVFAAVAPIYGGWYRTIFMDDEEWTNMTPQRLFEVQRGSSWVQAESLLTTPVFVNHCADDDTVNVNFSRYIVRQMQRWGYDIKYHETPTGGHHVPEDVWPSIMEWFLKHKRHNNPAQVRIRAAELQDASAHWVCVERGEKPDAFMLVDAEIIDRNTIRLDTENVEAVTLSPAGDLIDPQEKLSVIWNGTEHVQPLIDGRTTLSSKEYDDSILLKRPQLAGPIREVQRTPFIIVTGTTSTNALKRLLYEKHAKLLVANWKEWQRVEPRHVKDTDLTAEDMAEYSLILIGGPEDNSVARKLQDQIPLQLTEDQIIVDGHAFDAPDAVIQLAVPNPLNTSRYVFVLAATTANGLFHAGELPDGYDYCIADSRIAGTEDHHRHDKVLLACGTFDNAWRFSTNFLSVGDPEIRAEAPIRHVPQYTSAAIDGDKLYLSDLLEQKTDRCYKDIRRNCNGYLKPLNLGDKTYAQGISTSPWRGSGSIQWDISNGNWTTLQSIIGLEPREEPSENHLHDVHVRFIVEGDGKELYRSGTFTLETAPETISVPIDGVDILTLKIENDGTRCGRVIQSIDWADLHLAK